MSLKDNPLYTDEPVEQSHRNDTAYGTVTELKEHDRPDNFAIKIGKFLWNSLLGGFKLVGIILMTLGFGVIVFGGMIGIPVLTMQAFENGNYVWGGLGVLVILIAVGFGYNENNKL